MTHPVVVLFLVGAVSTIGSAVKVGTLHTNEVYNTMRTLTGGDILRFLIKNHVLDIFRSSDILQVLDELSKGRILWFFDNIDGNDVMRALLSIHHSSVQKSPYSTRNLDSLSGGSFGYSKRLNTISGGAFGISKRNFDEIDNVGFNGFAKRNMDEIDNTGFRGFIKRYGNANGRTKRNIHKTDHTGFNGFFKR
ncbi:uncharacterized protein LOC143254271 [Tachypleus tridentatus]|uniref:uncharacterized protein LOC143254271 n=1 Tax=Tachypleus tridentatus TaxID=6853 RepID=UPI003FD50B54